MMERRLLCLLPVLAVNLWRGGERERKKKKKRFRIEINNAEGMEMSQGTEQVLKKDVVGDVKYGEDMYTEQGSAA